MMTQRFENQVAVVSGGAEGLGKAIAIRLAREGARLILFDINAEKLQGTSGELGEMGYDVKGVVVDVADEASVRSGYESVAISHEKIDIMINSAGIVGPTNIRVLDYEVSDFDKVYRVNLRGAFLMTKYALKSMTKHKYGRILMIASIAGKEGNPYMCGYSSTKAGVIGLVKGLAKEFATDGITINGLAPAVIKTAMNDDTAPEQLVYMTSRIPMGRLGEVEEVAAMAGFIVSPENSFSTGFIYDISGGRATY